MTLDYVAPLTFPTRRCSDVCGRTCDRDPLRMGELRRPFRRRRRDGYALPRYAGAKVGEALPSAADRSEEHTSELQSRLHLVCRLLLEKKNQPDRQSVVIPSI